MKTLNLNKTEAIDKIAIELESGSDARHLVGYTESAEKGRFLYVDPQGRTWPSEYVGERTFRLLDLVSEFGTWEVPDGAESDEQYFEWRDKLEAVAKDEIEAELLDEYKHDSLIDPDGEDVKIIWV